TGTIGLIGGSMLDPFFPELAEGVQQAGRERDFTLFFASSNDDPDQQQRALDSFIGRAVDGIIVFPVKANLEPIREIVRRGAKVVAVNLPTQDPTITSINSDIVGGAMLAVEHLQRGGRRRIGFLANRSPHSFQREVGYRQALRTAADTAHEPLIHEVAPTADDAGAGVEAMLVRWPDLDALFTYNDVMAMAAIHKLHNLGRSVPDDIAVVGFDNIGLSALVNPPLTTIDLKQTRVGRTAVELLDTMINNPDEPVRHVLQPVELVARDSSDPVRHPAPSRPSPTGVKP
ncbi:MAG: substrate-binding domain-containing protein, partial [Acidimicrobiia bacterium]|nr:substrate-binding domain-containing protein [Acidimicrobiia bacterium]